MLQKWMEVLSSGTVEKILQIMLLMVVFLIPIPLMMTVEPFMLKQDIIQ